MDKKEENVININVACEQLRQSLTNDINGSGLPVSVVFLIVQNLYNELNTLYQQALIESQTEKEEKFHEVI